MELYLNVDHDVVARKSLPEQLYSRSIPYGSTTMRVSSKAHLSGQRDRSRLPGPK